MLTIEYQTASGRWFRHSGRGESFTRFLANLEKQRIPYRYVTREQGSNLFAGIVIK